MDGADGLPKLLIVDDSRIVRATLLKHIRGLYETREEADGEAGWNALQEDGDIQVVLSDLTMPLLDGYGLLERIRGSDEARLREIPVIMISGDEDDSARERASALGATDFVTKGTGPAELRSRIASAVKLAQARVALEAAESRAMPNLVDPESGLMTAEGLVAHADKVLAFAERHRGEVCIMAIAFDGFERLRARYGEVPVGQLSQQFGQMLSKQVRKEDSLASLEEGSFLLVSQDTSYRTGHRFAQRVAQAVRGWSVQWRGESVSLSVSIGLAETCSDGLHAIDELVGRARLRLDAAVQAGGDCVMGCETEGVCQEGPMSLEGALSLLANGRGDAVSGRLAELWGRLLPLLALTRDEWGGIGADLVAEAERRQQTTVG